MIYQKLLADKDAYFVSSGPSEDFPIHRHPEIELSYCIEGEYEIIIDNRKYVLKEGDLAFVKPMASHEIKSPKKAKMLTIETGPGLLSKHFDLFMKFNFNVLIEKCENSDAGIKLRTLLNETAFLMTNRTEFSDLAVKGNIFKICHILIRDFAKNENTDIQSKDIRDIIRVEKAIQIIYKEYSKPLNIDYVSEECGYSKSNFCRVFKKITGETFYSVLNRHRVEIACIHLKESRAMLDEVAFQVGFADSKSFCRVFKKIMKTSPGRYRKEL